MRHAHTRDCLLLAEGGSIMTEHEVDVTVSQEGAKAAAQKKQAGLDLLLDGCLGLALSTSCVVLVYIQVVWAQQDIVIGGVYAVYMALAVAAAFAAGSIFSERLQTQRGQKALFAIYTVSLVGCVAMSAIQFHLVTIIFSCVCLMGTDFLYSEFLNALPRHALMTVVDVLVACAGLFVLFIAYMGPGVLFYVQAGVGLVAFGLTFAFSRKGTAAPQVVSDDDSLARHIPLRGNRHTLFLIGFMFGSIELMFWLDNDFPPQRVWLVLGVAIAAAGVFSLAIKGLDERNYKDLLLKCMATCAAVLLLPLIILSGVSQLVFLALFVFVATLELIVLLNAVIESARFNLIAPIWLYGREGAVFFAGVAIGALLYVLAGWLSGQYAWAIDASICVAVMACCVLQIRVNYQCYPFESALESEKTTTEIATVQEQTGRFKALWQRKIQTACDRYKLSPREREVRHILVRGRDTKYVMDTFCISQSTAKTHIYNIYRKFDIHSRQDLLDFIEDIEPDPLPGE